MSHEAFGWAARRDTGKSGTKLLLMFLAEAADHYGVAVAGRDRYATLCCCSVSAVSANLGRLEAEGEIQRVRRAEVSGRRIDVIVLAPRAADRGQMEPVPADHPAVNPLSALASQCRDSGGDSALASQCRDSGPGYIEKTSTSQGSRSEHHARAKAIPGWRIAGRPVKREWWELTERILAAYNEATGSKIGARTTSGLPSATAKRIYGRVREWPDMTFERHKEIIERALASKWWGKGKPTIGVVYGPGVFEDNMNREAPPPDKRSRFDDLDV